MTFDNNKMERLSFSFALVAQLNSWINICQLMKNIFTNFQQNSSLSALDQSVRPSWVAPANHQFPNLAGIGEKGNLPIWKIYRFLIDSDSCLLLLVTSAPLVTFFQPILSTCSNVGKVNAVVYFGEVNFLNFHMEESLEKGTDPTHYWFVN